MSQRNKVKTPMNDNQLLQEPPALDRGYNEIKQVLKKFCKKFNNVFCT